MSIYRKDNCMVRVHSFYAVNLQGFDMEMHRHLSCEIMYVTAGRCSVFIDGREVQLREKQGIYIDAWQEHKLYVSCEKPCVMMNLEFAFSQNKKGSANSLQVARIYEKSSEFREFLQCRRTWFVIEDVGKLGYGLKDFIHELQTGASRENLYMELLFERILMELSYCYQNRKQSSGMLHLKRAKEYIHAHLYEDIHVSQVADYTGVNHSYLQSVFSRELGCGIIGYVNQLRMEHAAFLLNNSQMKILEIAFYLGYNSRQHFGYIFEKHFGMSPKVYRNLHGQGELGADTKGRILFIDEDGKRHQELLD